MNGEGLCHCRILIRIVKYTYKVEQIRRLSNDLENFERFEKKNGRVQLLMKYKVEEALKTTAARARAPQPLQHRRRRTANTVIADMQRNHVSASCTARGASPHAPPAP